jgi:hypothetical protein
MWCFGVNDLGILNSAVCAVLFVVIAVRAAMVTSHVHTPLMLSVVVVLISDKKCLVFADEKCIQELKGKDILIFLQVHK